MGLTLNRGLAFLLGFGFAFLPALGPFAALFVFLSNRWSFRRSDAFWLAAALVSALASGLHAGWSGLGLGALQIIGPWLIYKAFFQFHRSSPLLSHGRSLSVGLLAGVALVVFQGFFQIERFSFASKTLSQAIIWGADPGLYGHTLLAVGGLTTLLLGRSRLGLLSLGLCALGILISGSREAAIAWLFIALVFVLVGAQRSLRRRLVELGLVGLMLAVSVGLGPALGWGRVGFLLDLVPAQGNAENLIQGSEILNGDWWDTTWTQVRSSSVTLKGQDLTSYHVTKKGVESWLRLQQVVPLQTAEAYTLSVWLRAEPGVLPGIQGWGQLIEDKTQFVVSSALMGSRWQAGVTGPGKLLGSGIAETEGDWQRVFVSFTYEGKQQNLPWYVGLAPDRQASYQGSAEFAGFQLERGETLSPYRAGPSTKGLTLAAARIPYWQAAWRAVLERPLIGWGEASFPAYYRDTWPDEGRVQAVPSHTHNLVLQVLFEKGLLGLIALGLLLSALAGAALLRRDLAFLTVFAALLFANSFDYSLFYGGVLYPLAAVAGWRAAQASDAQTAAQSEGVVRMALALTDFLMAFLALVTASALRQGLANWFGFAETASSVQLVTNFHYALLLWPILSWREGLYPGYGLTPQQELRKQVSACFYAGLILIAGTGLFYQTLPVSRLVTVLMILFSIPLLPLGRALNKRLLHRLGLWGREVLIIGAGPTGERVARALQRSPLDGLRPVAFFDDDRARKVAGLPVVGPLSQAEAYAAAHGVQHAIVAIPALSTEAITPFARHQRVFKRVQFVPELSGLPAEDTYASNLDGLLALEIRSGLYARRNRMVKRLIDVMGSFMAAFLALPLLLILYLLVRLDSRGPAFHLSKRIGQNGKPFYCFKFRTMYVDAEQRLEGLLERDPALKREYQHFHKLAQDPRLTRIGTFLRRYSLDELPQLINVLMGEMSLVGPRPYLTRERKDMQSYRQVIAEVRPGITGLWQTSGRNDLSFQERLVMEAHYVRNWSIWWDIVILLRTFAVVFGRRGAH